MVTVRDIAAAAQVSPMTVSNVINGRSQRVSPDTRDRIRGIMKEMGYVPSAQARALSSNRSNVLALVFQSGPEGPAISNPYDAAIIGQIERSATAGGRYLMIHGSDDVMKTAEKLKSWRVDGAVILGTVGAEVDKLQAEYNIPMVFLDNYSSTPGIATVGIDDAKGGYLAGCRLIEAGHRELAFVGPDIQSGGVVHERYRGFSQAIAEAGIPPASVRIHYCDARFEAGMEAAEKLSNGVGPPTGIFATADIIALGLLKALLTRGVSVPDDVSIIGFDGLEETVYVTPSITTIGQDVQAKARAAVETLLAMIDGGAESSSPERTTLDVKLLERETVGPPPGR